MLPETIADIVRVEGGPVVATLYRMTGSLDLAEEAFADATVAALERWPVDGIPERPGAWLTTVARRKAIDRLRREAIRSDRERAAIALRGEPEPLPTHTVVDDHLRLIFTCCHPALSRESQVALALRLLSGLTTVEIARAFLANPVAMGQRISRAKAKVAANRIGLTRAPTDADLPDRLPSVLAVVNVIFTAGHHAATGPALHRIDLAEEAIRLARQLVALMPDEPECAGLLALLLSTHARRTTRVDQCGHPILLRDADRTRWDHHAAAEARTVLEGSLRRGRVGPFQIQAAISCLHTAADHPDATDWPQIVTLYRLLERVTPGPVVRVNRAIAEAEVHGPAYALTLLDTVAGASGWTWFHAARADLLERVGRPDEAAEALRRALACEPNAADAAVLEERLHALTNR